MVPDLGVVCLQAQAASTFHIAVFGKISTSAAALRARETRPLVILGDQVVALTARCVTVWTLKGGVTERLTVLVA